MKKSLLLCFTFIFGCGNLLSQVSMNSQLTEMNNQKTKSAENQFEKHPTKENGIILKTFFENKKPKYEIEYIVVNNKFTQKPDTIGDGTAKEWYENGQLKYEQNFTDNKFNGFVKSYWPNGKLKRDDIYLNDSLMNGICYDSTGIKTNYYPYSKMPEFKGGDQGLMRFLSSKVAYPYEAQRQGIEGRVILQFVVKKNGIISDIRVVRKVNYYLDKEAIRVVQSMPKWNPGLIENEPVNVSFTLPINFKLQ